MGGQQDLDLLMVSPCRVRLAARSASTSIKSVWCWDADALPARRSAETHLIGMRLEQQQLGRMNSRLL